MFSPQRGVESPHVLAGAARALVVAVLLSTACAPPDPFAGYLPAADGERAAVIDAIERYYQLLGHATLSDDLSALYAAFPKLAQGEVREAGINSEAFFVRVARSPEVNVVELTFELESYEKIRVHQRADEAVAVVHGLERKLYGMSPVPSLGEIFVRFDLRRDAGHWSIERSTGWVLGGRPPRTPRP